MTRTRAIVIGAGSAGSVMARRLVDADFQVTLVEAGPDGVAPPGVASPSFFDALAEPGRIWPDLMATRVSGRPETLYARGRGVGGSSAVNAMIGLWGEPDDYDRWERDHFCTGWSWKDVLPVFKRMPVPLRTPRLHEVGPVGRAIAAIGHDEGWVEHVGPGAVGPLGRDVGACRLTQDTEGHRVSAFGAYVSPVRSDPRLVVRTDVEVDRVAIENDRATGVVLVDGTVLDAEVVVVAAGAIETPRILLRSELENPHVGIGIQDHAAATFTLAMKESWSAEGLAVGVVGRFTSGRAPADLQVLPIDHLGPDAPGLAVLNVALMNVHSRGVVDLEQVSFDMLSDERDLATLVDGVRTIRPWFARRPLTDVVSAVLIDDRGTPLDALGSDDDSLRQWVTSVTGDYVHAAGSCSMGRRGESVVDPSGRSWDVEGLWLADASVMPRLPRANTHLPTVMVAERVAEFLVGATSAQ